MLVEGDLGDNIGGVLEIGVLLNELLVAEEVEERQLVRERFQELRCYRQVAETTTTILHVCTRKGYNLW